jgi:hypothetical protein
MTGDATREELAKFPLDEQWHVSAILLLAREECLQMPARTWYSTVCSGGRGR